MSTAAPEVRNLPLSVIRVDHDRFQIRNAMNPEAVNRYADNYASGDALPPLRVVQMDGEFWLAAGHHRYQAAREAGLTTVPCTIIAGDAETIITEAIRENALHGVELTREDRRRAVLMLIETAARRPTIRELAELVKVPHSTVARWVRESEDQDNELPPEHRPAPAPEPDPAPAPTAGVYDDEPSDPDLTPSAQVALARRVTAGSLHAEQAITHIRDVRRAVASMCKDDLFFRLKQVERSVDDRLAYAEKALEARRPAELCPACNGDGCKPCEHKGFMTEETVTVWRQDQARKTQG